MNSLLPEMSSETHGEPRDVGSIEELRELLREAGEKLGEEEARMYVFVPFTPKELKAQVADCPAETSLSKLAERRAGNVDLRQLAISLREIQINSHGMSPAVTTCSPEELLAWFNRCDLETREKVMEKAASKVPFILNYQGGHAQTRDSDEARYPRAGDTVIISAHGSSKNDQFASRQQGGVKLSAQEILARMREDNLIPEGISKIRLACCGSRNGLYDTFKQACEREGAYVGATLIAYGLENAHSSLFSYGSEASEDPGLILHDLDKGLRTVFSKDEQGQALKSVRAQFYHASKQVYSLNDDISRMGSDDEAEKQEREAELDISLAKKDAAFASMQELRDAEQKSTRCKVRDQIKGTRSTTEPAAIGQPRGTSLHQ